MYGDSQRKGVSKWNMGPETEPQLKQLYHGLGGEPVYHYTGNPVSWLVTLTQCIPFLKLNTGEQDRPVDQAVADDVLNSFNTNADLPLDTGSNFTFDPTGAALNPPQTQVAPFNPPPAYIGFSPAGVPLGTIHGNMVPLRASRRTYTGG